MKKSAAVCAGVAFVALAWTGAATAASHSSETAQLAVGASTTIVLSENPTTGYRWQIDKGQSANLGIVQISNAGYQPGDRRRLGAPGTHRWRIKALAVGRARIEFDYVRSWEHGAPVRRHTVHVVIK